LYLLIEADKKSARGRAEMKAILLVFLVLNINSSFASGWASGGGDPKLVKIKVFPYMWKIKAAVQLLKENLDKTRFNDNFKNAFKEDLDKLLKPGHFYYIPKLFAVGFNRYPGDYTKLYSNGAMTEFKPGAPIYFSKKAKKYDVRTLARVIGQEVPHHIFKGRFQRDETFANNLGTYLVLLDKVPTKPYNAAQIIYEEFDHELRDESSQKKIARARKDFTDGKNVLDILYELSHSLYKIRGSYHWYHVEFDYLKRKDLFVKHPKTAEITALEKLQVEKIAQCVFTSYEDGPSGVTKAYQKLLAETFVKLLEEFKSKIKGIYFLEDFYLPSMKIVSNCGVGVEDNSGQMMIFKAIFRHEDNQCGGDDNPCDIDIDHRTSD